MNKTDENYVVLDLGVIILLDKIIMWSLLPVGTLGIITNSLNVVVYAMISFQDSIFLCFFVMSVFDLFYIIIISSTNIFKIISLIEPGLLYYFENNTYRLSFYGDMLFDISVCVKTFIAVQRGCCVAFPFHVSKVFTRKRAAAVILCLCLLSLANYISDEFMRVQISFKDVLNNETYYFLIYSESTIVADKIRRNFNKSFLICACDFLILFSLIVIVYGMASSLKLRQSFSVGKVKILLKSKLWVKIQSSFNLNEKDVSNDFRNCKPDGNILKRQKISKNSRELRVVKQVALISTLHLICYTPVAVCAIMYETLTSSYFSFQLYMFYITINLLLPLMGSLNATINFFIYQTYNYKFKQTLLKICKRMHKVGY